MKLINRTITCGGKNGCSCVFEFAQGTSVQTARGVLELHRAEPDHAAWAAAYHNAEARIRELMGTNCKTPECLRDGDPTKGGYCLRCWGSMVRAVFRGMP